jgi:UDP-N-acetylmuramoyl-tripeptide--D-alanyl-D-alanine ligase
MRWNLVQAAEALGVAAPSGVDAMARLAGVSIDSRSVQRGELFIAIRGPRHDGHSFVADALAGGAVAGVVARERAREYGPELRAKLLVVEDTLAALQELARKYCDGWRKAKTGRRVAAVTGSAGKTTTKEILAALLGARFRVLKSEGNLNNEYGLPLTIFRLADEHEAAVFELGMSRRGELARLAAIARPDVGVVTNVAPVHLEFFSSVDEIALAKRELIEGLGGKDPLAVLNADDARVARFAEVFRGRVHFYGVASEKAEFRAVNIESRGIEGSAFDFESPTGRARLELPLVGRHNVLNALAGLAAASEWGIGAAEAKRVLSEMEPASMRGEILRFAHGFVVINDSYNSNPAALERMIDLLCETPGYKRKILVAGAWREIGPTSADLHRATGRYAAEKKVDWILGVEGDAREFVRGAVEAGHASERARFFETSEDAAKSLPGFVKAGDLILVKGSRGVHMEVIAAALREKFAMADESARAAHGEHATKH